MHGHDQLQWYQKLITMKLGRPLLILVFTILQDTVTKSKMVTVVISCTHSRLGYHSNQMFRSARYLRPNE